MLRLVLEVAPIVKTCLEGSGVVLWVGIWNGGREDLQRGWEPNDVVKCRK